MIEGIAREVGFRNRGKIGEGLASCCIESQTPHVCRVGLLPCGVPQIFSRYFCLIERKQNSCNAENGRIKTTHFSSRATKSFWRQCSKITLENKNFTLFQLFWFRSTTMQHGHLRFLVLKSNYTSTIVRSQVQNFNRVFSWFFESVNGRPLAAHFKQETTNNTSTKVARCDKNEQQRSSDKALDCKTSPSKASHMGCRQQDETSRRKAICWEVNIGQIPLNPHSVSQIIRFEMVSHNKIDTASSNKGKAMLVWTGAKRGLQV